MQHLCHVKPGIVRSSPPRRASGRAQAGDNFAADDARSRCGGRSVPLDDRRHRFGVALGRGSGADADDSRRSASDRPPGQRAPSASLVRRLVGSGAPRHRRRRQVAPHRSRGGFPVCAGQRLRPGADESGRRAPPGRRAATDLRRRRAESGRGARGRRSRGGDRTLPDRREGPRPRSPQPFRRIAGGARRDRRPSRRHRTAFHLPDLPEEPAGRRPGSCGRV